HKRFISMAAEVIGAQVQPHYIVKIYEHVYVHELPAGSRRLLGRADTGLAAIPPAASASAAVGLLDAPARVRLLAVDVGVVRPKESTFFPLARFGPTTPKQIGPKWLRSIRPTRARRPSDASVDHTEARKLLLDYLVRLVRRRRSSSVAEAPRLVARNG